jgi:hypothetical protein
MQNEKTKDVIIGDKRFRISKMTPLIACRIYNWILSGSMDLVKRLDSTKNQPDDSNIESLDPVIRADQTVSMVWRMASTAWAEELVEKVQVHAMRTIAVYPNDDGPPLPVLVDTRWTDRDLESDALTVDKLVLESLKFNISPFFIGDKSKPAGA